ncbi:hypothetical protein DY000_02045101 [Brassica cretica]|uniref:Uncharacterized protein n=1 Tax=Brassica cretica TaxID=69181 RepID=A0ABQ7ERT0_BRACR|nr:hypothetical protein DY000_02045101 [Brassica cretica]
MFKVRTTTSPCSTSTRMYRSPPAHDGSRAQPSFLWISSNPKEDETLRGGGYGSLAFLPLLTVVEAPEDDVIGVCYDEK